MRKELFLSFTNIYNNFFVTVSITDIKKIVFWAKSFNIGFEHVNLLQIHLKKIILIITKSFDLEHPLIFQRFSLDEPLKFRSK